MRLRRHRSHSVLRGILRRFMDAVVPSNRISCSVSSHAVGTNVVCIGQTVRIAKKSVSIQGKKPSHCGKERVKRLTCVTGCATTRRFRPTAFGTARPSLLEVKRIGSRHYLDDDYGECDEDREVEFELHCRYFSRSSVFTSGECFVVIMMEW
jgi:hypothetical protein